MSGKESTLWFGFVASMVIACGAGAATPGMETRADIGAEDSPPMGTDARTCPPSTPSDQAYPSGPYGVATGDVLADFTLDNCEGQAVRFGDVLGGGSLALITIAAGWCGSCIEETRTLQVEVADRFCARGLRLIQVLVEDASGGPVTRFFCNRWREQYGLRFPVLVDPLFTTEALFADEAVPLNLLVDPEGVIRWRSAGATPADLAAQIEALLP